MQRSSNRFLTLSDANGTIWQRRDNYKVEQVAVSATPMDSFDVFGERGEVTNVHQLSLALDLYKVQ